MPRNQPSSLIVQHMSDEDRHDIMEAEFNREEARRALKKLRDRIRTRILYELSKEQSQ